MGKEIVVRNDKADFWEDLFIIGGLTVALLLVPTVKLVAMLKA